MSKIDYTYHKILETVLKDGVTYKDPNRKGVERIEIPRYSFYHSFEDGFPAISTKKLAWKSVVGETIWLLRGDTNIKYLVNNNINIWNDDAYNYYKSKAYHTLSKIETFNEWLDTIKRGEYQKGDLGRIYGYQLRHFNGVFDQLQWIINEMIYNPLSTKKDITYINPTDKREQGLTPCHTGWSILMRKDLSGFDLEFKMSSWDLFLGGPFNIAGYALIAKILEVITGHKALGIYCTAHNVHIYKPHLDAVKIQLDRDADKHQNCKLEITEDYINILKNDVFTLDTKLNNSHIHNFNLLNYTSDSKISAKMLAYNK